MNNVIHLVKTIFISYVLEWFNSLDNDVLDKIINLLMILVILIGLGDWLFNKIRLKRRLKRQKKGEENKENKPQEKANEQHENNKIDEKSNLIKDIACQQMPFKTISILDNPTAVGNKIGEIIDDFSGEVKMNKIKNFFKWLWYNKEQLVAILYNAAALFVVQYLTWTGVIEDIIPSLEGGWLLGTKIAVCVLLACMAVLTVRDIIVEYGLSNLEKISQVLEERKQKAEKKLSAEDKKTYKKYIEVLQKAKAQSEAKLAEINNVFREAETLFNLDNSLVPNFADQRAVYEAQYAQYTSEINTINVKIDGYNQILSNNQKVE